MKVLAILGAFVLLVLVGVQAGGMLFSSFSNRTNVAATFINDSVIVDLGEDDFEEPTDEEGVDSIPENEGDTETVVFTDDDDESGGVIDEVIITVSDTDDNSDSGSDSSNNDSSGQSSNTSNQNETQETVSAQSILNTLTGSQAVTSSGSNVGGGGFGTSVSGTKTREALLSRKITNLLIPVRPSQNDSSTVNRSPYSRGDLALIVSAELVKNPELEDVFYTTNALTMTYKARGRLLFAVPVPYTTSLELTFDEVSTNKRVRVKFPWYKFFMWTGVSKSALRTEIDRVITTAPAGEDYDKAAHVFEEITTLLKSTRGFRGLQ